MYQSKKRISTDNMQQLKSDLGYLLKRQKKVICKSLKRPVSLEKLPDVFTKRHDAKRRLQALIVGLDIVRHSPSCAKRIIKGYICYEFRGKDIEGNLVTVHLREEVMRKDRILFLVSCSTK